MEKIDILRKRNIELAQQVQNLESELKLAQDKLDKSNYEEVEKLRNEFNELIKEVKEKKYEYDSLINELKEMRKFMNTVEFKNHWIKKAKKDFLKQNKEK